MDRPGEVSSGVFPNSVPGGMGKAPGRCGLLGWAFLSLPLDVRLWEEWCLEWWRWKKIKKINQRYQFSVKKRRKEIILNQRLLLRSTVLLKTCQEPGTVHARNVKSLVTLYWRLTGPNQSEDSNWWNKPTVHIAGSPWKPTPNGPALGRPGELAPSSKTCRLITADTCSTHCASTSRRTVDNVMSWSEGSAPSMSSLPKRNPKRISIKVLHQWIEESTRLRKSWRNSGWSKDELKTR